MDGTKVIIPLEEYMELSKLKESADNDNLVSESDIRKDIRNSIENAIFAKQFFSIDDPINGILVPAKAVLDMIYKNNNFMNPPVNW